MRFQTLIPNHHRSLFQFRSDELFRDYPALLILEFHPHIKIDSQLNHGEAVR